MYMCQVVLFALFSVGVNGCICSQVEVLDGISKEVEEEAVQEVIFKDRD